MDVYEIVSLLMRLETRDADRQTVLALYSETLSEVCNHLTDDQMRRLLICGAYIHHGAEHTLINAPLLDATSPHGRGNIPVH